MTGARAALGGMLLSLCSACTMIGSVERYVPDRPELAGVRCEIAEPTQRDLGGPGWRIGGSPSELTLDSGTRVVQIRCREFAWYQHTFGPILPVFPVLMGAGPCFPSLEVHVRVSHTDEPFELAPWSVSCLVQGGGSPAPSWSRSDPRKDGESLMHLAQTCCLGDLPTVRLESGDELWLVYDADTRGSGTDFELELPAELAPEGTRLRFRRERTPFLFHMP